MTDKFDGKKFITGREGGDYYSGFYVEWLEEKNATLEQQVEGLENLLRTLDTPTAEAVAAMIKANKVPSPWRDAGIRLHAFGNWLVRASRMDKALAEEKD